MEELTFIWAQVTNTSHGRTSKGGLIMKCSYKILDDGTACIINGGSLEGNEIVSNSIIIPDTIDGYVVTQIGERVFDSIQTLKKKQESYYGIRRGYTLALPRGLKKICREAFYDCDGIKEFILPTGLETIEEYAFTRCGGIQSINIPESVLSISEGVFALCSDLEAINVQPGNEIYTSVDGVLYNKKTKALLAYPAAKQGPFSIPNGIQIISAEAFTRSVCPEIIIPDSVVEIGDLAFSYKFRSFTIRLNSESSKLQKIGANIFQLGNGTYPRDFGSPISFTIPASVTEISANPFSGMYIDNIEVSRNNSSFVVHDGVLYTADMNKLIAYPRCKTTRSYYIPNSVKIIGAAAFELCRDLTAVYLPDGLEVIEEKAFSECDGIKSIKLPSSIKRIEERAFQNVSLSEIDIPEKTEYIGKLAFDGSIKSDGPLKVTVRGKETVIHAAAFRAYHGMNTMQVIPNSSAEQYAKSENVSYSYLDGSGNEKDPFAWLS